MDVRTRHNEYKFSLLQHYIKPRGTLLDVGAGRGGDVHKWRKLRLKVTAVEPNWDLLCEAKQRSLRTGRYVEFVHGDIRSVPEGTWDVVTYMFSLHYILEDDPVGQLKAALSRTSRYVVGIVPNGNAVLEQGQWSCSEGAFSVSNDGTRCTWRVDGPYYGVDTLSEPIMTYSMLKGLAHEAGGRLKDWKSLSLDGLSSFYSIFVLERL